MWSEELEVLALVPVTVQAAVLVGLVLLLVVVWREEQGTAGADGEESEGDEE